ncbi:MAG: UbiX family flavin prenyltransferase [Lachnospiraceae bacterium]|nr:UbiX family flavin prenyltransferase [Lachnospiraceae bacterium]
MKRIVVGISGASGFPLAVCLLKELKKIPEVETHLVFTYGAELTAKQESGMDAVQIRALADVCYENSNIGAAIASGTFLTEGMIILPCSMKTVSGIAHGFSENLLLRAADVTIKERRNLVLAVREMPLSPIHLENMLTLSRLQNVYIMPPMVTYYMKDDETAAESVDDPGKDFLQLAQNEDEAFTCSSTKQGGSEKKSLQVSDMERHIVGKLLQPFGIEIEGFRRWS